MADRQNAQYTDQQLRSGQNLQAVAPPLPETPAAPTPKVAAAPTSAPAPAATPAQKTSAARPVTERTQKMPAVPIAPVKQEVLPPPLQTAAAKPVPAPAAAVPSRAAVPPSSAPAPQVAMAPIVNEKDRAQNQATKSKPDEQKKPQHAQVKRGAEPPPAELALRPPAIGGMPAGEEARAAPPPPEEVAAATPPHSDVDGTRSVGTGRAIEINFAHGPFKARILPADRNRLVDVAKLARRNNARVRVIGYGGASGHGDSAEREFQSFNAALDNAKAVGIELAKLGVPAEPHRHRDESESSIRPIGRKFLSNDRN